MNLKIQMISLSVYLLTVIFLISIGYIFEIKWLQFIHTSYHSDGVLKEKSGSLIAFFISMPVYGLMIKKLKQS